MLIGLSLLLNGYLIYKLKKLNKTEYFVNDINKFMYDVLKVGFEGKSKEDVADKLATSFKKFYDVDYVSIFYYENDKFYLLSSNIEDKYKKRLEKYINEVVKDKDKENKVIVAEDGGVLSYYTAKDRGIKFSSLTILHQGGNKVGLILLESKGASFSDLSNRLNLYNKVFEGTSFVLHNILMVEKLYRLSSKDQLTGVYNRRFIDEELKKYNKTKGYSLVLFDIDYFKKFNDRFGHSFGDLVLKRVANEVENLVGDNGWVARYGGEEFLIFLNKDDKKDVFSFVENIRMCIENCNFDFNNDKVSVTSSFGIAISDGSEDVNTLINYADLALYESKRKGRNTVTIYDINNRLIDSDGIIII